MGRLRHVVALLLAPAVFAEHHMTAFKIERRQSGQTNIPISVVNSCQDTIYPAILTQGGTGPSKTGWQAKSGSNQTVYVSADWQGRVWARTNCTWNASGASGTSCSTGDCGGLQACKGPGVAPASLAEFTLNGSNSQTFYDISLVDGYNLPIAIVMLPEGNSKLEAIDPSTTNPSCVASVSNLAPQNFNPYTNNQQFLGTSGSSPLPFNTQTTQSQVASWCPWDLQVSPPLAPGDGVYPYPDGNVVRPAFDPCYSACVKYGQANYCCTGRYNSPNKCQPNYYAKAAKAVCPDAYSYAYDDQTSTFINPTGAGYQVVFCPGGRSTNIIASKGTGSIQHGS